MIKLIIKNIKNLFFVPILLVFNIIILVPALLLVLCRKINKQAIAIDSEITSTLYKWFRKK